VCLIARHFEANSLPTLILGSGLDIMASGLPPRAAFLNYPLGFESGRFQDTDDQYQVVKSALACFDRMEAPGIHHLDCDWPEGWAMIEQRDKERAKVNPDQRSTRDATPQYQLPEDKRLADLNHSNPHKHR